MTCKKEIRNRIKEEQSKLMKRAQKIAANCKIDIQPGQKWSFGDEIYEIESLYLKKKMAWAFCLNTANGRTKRVSFPLVTILQVFELYDSEISNR